MKVKLYTFGREKLIYRYPLISVGWLNHQTPLIKWTQPNAELAAKNLIELVAKALIFMPIGFANGKSRNFTGCGAYYRSFTPQTRPS
jgi:protoheme ferro-lyase